MAPEEFREISQLIGGFTTGMRAQFQEFRLEMRNEFRAVNDRLDRIEARLDDPGGLLQSGFLWVNRLRQWSESMDRLALKHRQHLRDRDSRPGRPEHPNA